MAKHGREELKQYQSLPLSAKIAMTNQRITDWVDHYGIDGVYISFSGGKDSTVLMHLVRNIFPDAKAVFFNTGLEYPEIRHFVETFANVEWVRPDISFKDVIQMRGYPFVSKEVSEAIDVSRNCLRKLRIAGLVPEKIPGGPTSADLFREELKKDGFLEKAKHFEGIRSLMMITGTLGDEKEGETSQFSKKRWDFMLDAPFEITASCCYYMKKKPAKTYARVSGRQPITGMMASDSRMRERQWMLHGCNGFDMVSPISNPMAFWTENDVLTYIRLFGKNMVEDRQRAFITAHPEKSPMEFMDEFSGKEWQPICSVYGEIVTTLRKKDLPTWKDDSLNGYDQPKLLTTGCERTGCIFCGFGCHLDRPGNGRFARLKETHPKQYDFIMKDREDGGLGFRKTIDWMNENGNLNIEY